MKGVGLVMKGVGLVGVLALSGTLCTGPATAQPAGEFYKGKQIDMFIGTPAGGGYDQYGRLLGRHMSKYIPGNPAVIFRNMPAGGGRQAMNHVYNVAPADGTAIGITIRSIAFDPLFGETATMVDALKLTWIGSLNNEIPVCVAWHTSPFKTVDDMRKSEIVMGSSGQTAADSIHAKLLNQIAGTKIRAIHGYNGSSAVHLAMERGEVQGRCGLGWDSIVSRYDRWLKEKQISVLVQFGLSKHPDIPQVTSIMDLATTEKDRQLAELMVASLQMGRPFFAPPGVPADRVEILRRALDATAKDPAFLADVEKQKVEVFHMTGEEVETLVRRIHAMPKDVVEIGRQLSTGK
jgi:tripartite-type tricarboxylate transporter receptor subunit TctC